jgi:hypothetical protein
MSPQEPIGANCKYPHRKASQHAERPVAAREHEARECPDSRANSRFVHTWHVSSFYRIVRPPALSAMRLFCRLRPAATQFFLALIRKDEVASLD